MQLCIVRFRHTLERLPQSGPLEAGDSVKQFADVGSQDVVLPYWELTPDAWVLLADLASDPSTDTWAAVDYTLDQVSFFNIPFATRYKVLIIDEIPQGATGKLERIGLAEKLGIV